MFDRPLFLRWVRATWLGWLLGIPIIIMLALIGEAMGIGGSQALVGAGMGTGVGLMQWRVVRDVVHKSTPWFWSSVFGLALPFLLADISKMAAWGVEYSLPLCVTLGGVIAGGLQALILNARFRRTWLWVVGSALGWTCAALAALVADSPQRYFSLRGIWGALVFLAVVAGGGLCLGLVTGLCLAWIASGADNQLNP